MPVVTIAAIVLGGILLAEGAYWLLYRRWKREADTVLSWQEWSRPHEWRWTIDVQVRPLDKER